MCVLFYHLSLHRNINFEKEDVMEDNNQADDEFNNELHDIQEEEDDGDDVERHDMNENSIGG